MTLKDLNIDKSWTLFLDRDGVINKKLDNDYVKNISEFEFLPGAISAISELNKYFGITVVVTNQQGIGKKLMTERDLMGIHDFMLEELEKNNAHINAVYHCPELAQNDPSCRKPKTGMGLFAKKDFPEIDFKKSIIAGDSMSDMEFGKNLGMNTCLISSQDSLENDKYIDLIFPSLAEFSRALTQ